MNILILISDMDWQKSKEAAHDNDLSKIVLYCTERTQRSSIPAQRSTDYDRSTTSSMLSMI